MAWARNCSTPKKRIKGLLDRAHEVADQGVVDQGEFHQVVNSAILVLEMQLPKEKLYKKK